jgi:hypothetical protein
VKRLEWLRHLEEMISRALHVLVISVCAVQLAAAQHDATSQPESPGQTRQAEKDQSRRMLGIPQFGVTNEKHPAPLKPGEKFRLFYRTAVDPAQFVVIGLEAGISQASNSFPGYGQGASGYGKRYGAAFADQVSNNFFATFVYPVILKQDPRYFRMGEGPVKRRFFYALAQEFVGHKDGGRKTFNWPTTLGALTAGGISNAYYPEEDRGFGLTVSRAAVSMLYGSLSGLGNEFWPDISRKLHRNRKSVPGDQPQK